MRRRMPVASFAGYSGSGKTTLICGILDLLTKKSLRIGVIKHHGHGTDSDLDGIMKDTELFQRHGAAFVQLLVGGEKPEPVLDSLEEEPLDLILVEGFKKSGAHINHAEHKMPHGLLNPAGPDDGDLPNVYAGPDGKVNAELFTTRARISAEGPGQWLWDADGSAIIIHANPDDQVTDPSGNSGERIVCGVIKAANGQ